MPLVAAVCPHCGGKVEMEENMEHGFCVYCGTKIINERKVTQNITNIISGPMKFYLIIFKRGVQYKFLVKDEFSFHAEFRSDATMGDKDPINLIVTSDGKPLDQKIRCYSVSKNKTRVVYTDGAFNLSREDRVDLAVNGTKLDTTEATLGFGDIIRAGDVIFRLMPCQN